MTITNPTPVEQGRMAGFQANLVGGQAIAVAGVNGTLVDKQ